MNKTLNEIEANEVTERDNLAVVAIVERLEDIPGKDRIGLVYLKDVGYTFICEKIHKVGDLVVYIKFDTIVPDNELFSFMRETKFRVKAKSFTEKNEVDIVVRKVYSQGIVLPIQKVIDLLGYTVFKEGDDLTNLLEVKKYIPPVVGSGSGFGVMSSKGDFPTHFVSKTDEDNLASRTKILREIIGKDVYITQKLEGSSITFMWDESRDELMVCSRNNQIGEHETNKFWQAVNKYDLKTKMKEYPYLIGQGELCGPGIQKNKLGLSEVDMFIFNFVDRRDRALYDLEQNETLSKILGLKLVPLVSIVKNFQMTFDELQKIADSQKYENGETAEGIVVRLLDPCFSNFLQKPWSAKVINREYKL